jgi:hypothetical protein
MKTKNFMKKAILVAMGFVGLATVACKKDDNNKPVTSVDLITSTTWKIDTIGFDNDKNGEIDQAVATGFKPCELDNTITFAKDSTGVFDEGALKCDPADAQTIPLTWQFKENDKVINIQGDLPGEMKGDINILALTNTSFVLSKNVTLFDSNLIIKLEK